MFADLATITPWPPASTGLFFETGWSTLAPAWFAPRKISLEPPKGVNTPSPPKTTQFSTKDNTILPLNPQLHGGPRAHERPLA